MTSIMVSPVGKAIRRKENEKQKPTVQIQARSARPKNSTLHIGPTNSGKTYNALNEMFHSFRNNPTLTHAYAGPLRMLAYEVYEKMVAEFGEENVGYITGEEQINPTAKLLACTVEMIPQQGYTIVLDEAHWLIDPSRGHEWGEVLGGYDYENFHVILAKEAVEAVEALLSDSLHIVRKEYERKTDLFYRGKINKYDIPHKTAVVCFSKKAVYSVATMLASVGHKVGVLYGMLPLAARKAQIEKYIQGDYDIIVTTDVIGHGINLPIDNVVFVQTEKFDGTKVRDLMTWEIGQIAGRAGRYGLSKQGSVYALEGWDDPIDTKLLMKGIDVGAGRAKSDLRITDRIIAPKLSHLNITNPAETLQALKEWHEIVQEQYSPYNITPADLSNAHKIIITIADYYGLRVEGYRHGAEWGCSKEDLWALINGPYQSNSDTLIPIFQWLTTQNRDKSAILTGVFYDTVEILNTRKTRKKEPSNRRTRQYNQHKKELVNTYDISNFEKVAQTIAELKMTHVIYQTAGSLMWSELLEYEERINTVLTTLIQETITTPLYGQCERCGDTTNAWFTLCEDCYQNRHNQNTPKTQKTGRILV